MQKANFSGGNRVGAIGFSIGTKGYLGTGMDGLILLYNDFWEYDPIANSWTQKANFPGSPRWVASGLSIGNFGYMGLGLDNSGVSLNDFWEYDPSNNTWTQKATFAGGVRCVAVAFSIGSKGYIGLGLDLVTNFTYNDFWEYDAVTDAWTQKANFGGIARYLAVGFSLNNFGYIGTGWTGAGAINDFWQYDALNNTWIQKANFGGPIRCEATSFVIGNKAYVATGTDSISTTSRSDLWEYEPVNDTWAQMGNYGGGQTEIASAFSIGCKGYLGTGFCGTGSCGSPISDFWEFTPPLGSGGNVIASIIPSANIICAGQSLTLTSSGGSNYSWNNGSTNNSLVVSPTVTTTYSVIVSDVCGSDTASITITVNQPPVPSVSGNASICNGASTTLTAYGGASYSWISGSINNSIVVAPTVTTTYSVIVSDVCGSDTAFISINVFSSPNSVFTSNNIPCTSTIQFTDNSENANSWVWDFGDGSTSTIQSPFHAYAAAGTYNVTLVANNSSVCSDTSSQTVRASEMISTLYIPNAFSPNRDNENDIFTVQGTDCVKDFLLAIYNRWGEKVFETMDVTKGWEGSYKGRKENPGVFTYYLKATLFSGEVIKKQGNVSLVR